VRGGLDDALDKMARRDELRRRAAGQAAGTPPAVTELVEAVAAVVARNPELGITMGVEGAGEPVLLHFAFDDGVVQVTADNPLSVQPAEPTSGPRHADFDLEPVEAPEPEEPARYAVDDDDPYDDIADNRYETAAAEAQAGYDDVRDTYTRARHHSSDDEDTFAGGAGYDPDGPYEAPPQRHFTETHEPAAAGYPEPSQADRDATYPQPLSFAATPPPQIPPQTWPSMSGRAAMPGQRTPPPAAQPASFSLPAPLPMPIPLRLEPEATELAAKRLAAMLREDPSLLQD
jgi:hypothetical protein